MTLRPSATDFAIVRTLPAPPATVFAAWTDPDQMVQWWGTDDLNGTACEIDLRTGGAWRACMSSPTGDDHWAGGTYSIIDPPRRLAFTFAWEAAGSAVSDVDITFVPVPEGTEMTFRQHLQVSPEIFDAYRSGWEETFARLTAHLTRPIP